MNARNEFTMLMALWLVGAAAVVAAVAPSWADARGEPISGCRATDGDTIRCGDERIRIIGIDAPELGSCRQGRVCVEGDPVRATETIAGELGKALTIERMGTDRYGRTLAHVYADGQSLACTQMAAGSAEYVERWDDRPRGRVASECGP